MLCGLFCRCAALPATVRQPFYTMPALFRAQTEVTPVVGFVLRRAAIMPEQHMEPFRTDAGLDPGLDTRLLSKSLSEKFLLLISSLPIGA